MGWSIALLLLAALFGCDAEVDPAEDVGPGDGGAEALCPARILPAATCMIAGLECPGPSELRCQCRGSEWRCLEADGG